MSQPLAVTVCVLTFNHEQYIRTALDSILKQKTDFRFEILVHDDCSTDRTQEIIIEYQKRYPDRIRTIFQSENQYSKGENFFDRAVYIHARGKYIALNEGDDFWLSESKLQTQYDFMEAHPDYSLCCHAALQANLSDELSDYRSIGHFACARILRSGLKDSGATRIIRTHQLLFFPQKVCAERLSRLLQNDPRRRLLHDLIFLSHGTNSFHQPSPVCLSLQRGRLLESLDLN